MQTLYIFPCGCKLKKEDTIYRQGYRVSKNVRKTGYICAAHKTFATNRQSVCIDCDKIVLSSMLSYAKKRCKKCSKENIKKVAREYNRLVKQRPPAKPKNVFNCDKFDWLCGKCAVEGFRADYCGYFKEIA